MDRAYQRLIWIHRKTGKLYQIVSFGLVEETLAIVVVYRTFSTDREKPVNTWTRPAEEFFDGRFQHHGEGGDGLPLFHHGGPVPRQDGGLMGARSVNFVVPADKITPPQEPPEGPGATVPVSVRAPTVAPEVDPVEERRRVDDGA
jgi:hypothetical protein